MSKKKPKGIKRTIVAKAADTVYDNEAYFVSVGSPLELRKQLLESSKKAVLCLQNYQRILLIRAKKVSEMAELKNSIKELVYLDRKFNEKLPKYEHEILQEPKKVKAEMVPGSKQEKPTEDMLEPPKPKRIPQRAKSELERLEESLANIEGKLNRLND